MISDGGLKATIANTLRRSQKTVKLMHLVLYGLKHKIFPMCLVGSWEGKSFVIRLSFKKVIILIELLPSRHREKKRGKTLVFLIFAKFWWKIKSLSTVGHLLYKDLTPRDVFAGGFSFSLFTVLGCLTSQCVG